MKTLVCTQPGMFEYRIAEVPEPTIGNAIIKIKRIGICGTDLHAFEGTQPFFEYPAYLVVYVNAINPYRSTSILITNPKTYHTQNNLQQPLPTPALTLTASEVL